MKDATKNPTGWDVVETSSEVTAVAVLPMLGEYEEWCPSCGHVGCEECAAVGYEMEL